LSFLLDTNVSSEVRRGNDVQVRAWLEEMGDADLCLSSLALGEIPKGIEQLRNRNDDSRSSCSRCREIRTAYIPEQNVRKSGHGRQSTMMSEYEDI
jgi:predicted nucleic acid-binding protein